MADLCAAREPGALHVPEAARRQAALVRRDPQGGRRLHRPAGKVPFQRDQRGRAPGESRLAHPQRPSAGGALSGVLRASAHSGDRVERAQSRGAVGLHPRLCAPSIARGESGPRPSRRFRDPLLRGFRQADQAIPRPDREGTRRDDRACRAVRRDSGRARRRQGAGRRLRDRQGLSVRTAARLVQGALRGPVRPVRRPPHSAPSPPCSAAPRRRA